ncbi:hypothetical protein niasHS_012556 [Heterodera schachtii]|uniref:Uncharacterized protein n=1 Tax=Heterodera schachtii TaxID=97005 RepID=A0ABD2I8X3_HETSC
MCAVRSQPIDHHRHTTVVPILADLVLVVDGAAWLGLSQNTELALPSATTDTLVSFTDRRHHEHLLYSKCAIANAEHGTRRPNSRSMTINANDLYEGTRSKSAKKWRSKTEKRGKSAAR